MGKLSISYSSKPLSEAEIIWACYENDLSTLKSYYQHGGNFDSVYDEFGDGVINLSIFLDQKSVFNQFLHWNLDVNHANLYTGETPLHIAALTGQTSYMKPLVEHGADLNAVDFSGFTPLLNAMFYLEYETAEYMLHAFDDVNVNIASDYGLSPLMLAYLDGEWSTIQAITEHPSYNATFNYIMLADTELYDLADYLLAHDLQGDLNFLEAFEAVKLLGLRYEFDGTFSFTYFDDYGSVSFNFEGYGNHQGIQAFYDAYEHYYENIIQTADLPNWAQQAFSIVYDAIAFSASTFDANAYLNAYLHHQPVIIPSGWDEHSITFVLHDDRLYRCNRGYLGLENYGIEEFIITKPENITVDLLEIMLDAQGSSYYLQNVLPGVLGLEKVGQVETTMQTVGNCVWASLEAGFEALMITTLLDLGLDSDSAHLLAKQNYLLWEEYDLTLGLNELVTYADILAENDLYDGLLLKVLDSSHDASNLFDLDKGVVLLDVLTQPEHFDIFDQQIGQYVIQYNPYSFQQISYMENYKNDALGVMDWILNTVGLDNQLLPKDVYEKGNAYYEFLLACDQYAPTDNHTVLSLMDMFAQDSLFTLDLQSTSTLPLIHNPLPDLDHAQAIMV